MSESSPLYPHQLEDIQSLLAKPYFALFNDPGTGKTRTVVEAFRQLDLDTLLVVCPAPARSVWADPNPQLGEVSKWWADHPELVEYHIKTKFLPAGPCVVVTNPEFIRRKNRLAPLRQWLRGRKTHLVLDEGWQYSNPRADQTKAAYLLRTSCERVTILNGTPGRIDQLFAQFQILSPEILDCENYWVFRARYCRLGGFKGKEIVGYQNVEDFQARTAPYAVRRALRDCVDMGYEPRRSQIEVPLAPATWKLYRELREDFISWITEHEACTAQQAGVRAGRLTQLTNGFLGGVQNYTTGETELKEIGREKVDALKKYIDDQGLTSALIFCRFRPDVERTAATLGAARLYGGQDEEERREAKLRLAPGGEGRGFVVANAQSGGASLTLTGTGTCFFLGNEFSLRMRKQAEGRIDRVGQVNGAHFIDVIATGPEGQRTIDHEILAAHRAGEDVAAWTAETWRRRV